jgi:hypothetical protein
MSRTPPEEAVMSKECVQIDERIEFYSILASRVTDPPLLDGLKDLLVCLQALKLALRMKQLH